MAYNNYHQIKLNTFNWGSLLSHPSEFIRIDEQLRIKQNELSTFNYDVEGWTKIAAQENLEHKRLVYSMRSYLYITCQNIFCVPILSRVEYDSLKSSFVDRENIITEKDQDYATLTSMSQANYLLILHLSSDRYNTERLYRKILGRIIDSMNTQLEYAMKEKMIDTIIKKCFFSLQ